ncbi:unnamed protein product [Cercospora beticola]|nr:unnamed protein product [Cercospora beticola]
MKVCALSLTQIDAPSDRCTVVCHLSLTRPEIDIIVIHIHCSRPHSLLYTLRGHELSSASHAWLVKPRDTAPLQSKALSVPTWGLGSYGGASDNATQRPPRTASGHY